MAYTYSFTYAERMEIIVNLKTVLAFYEQELKNADKREQREIIKNMAIIDGILAKMSRLD